MQTLSEIEADLVRRGVVVEYAKLVEREGKVIGIEVGTDRGSVEVIGVALTDGNLQYRIGMVADWYEKKHIAD